MLGDVGVGAGEQDAVVGEVGQRGPLRPVTRQLPSSACTARVRQRREVAAGGRLAEQLAPQVVSAQQPPEVTRPLVLAAVVG